MRKQKILLFPLLLLFLGTARPLFGLPPELEKKIEELNAQLINRGVAASWLNNNIKNNRFRIHYDIVTIFHNMAEYKVERNEKDFEWYKTHFGLDYRIKTGLAFIEANRDLLAKVETKNGIHYELVTAILGIETNFADAGQRGSYYTFNALVSQYLLIPSRENFAVNQLTALFQFSKKTYKSSYYFIGSFAGACGWAQFIPSSLLNYYVDANSDYADLDIYALDDTLFSIENYLFKHGLSARSIEHPGTLYNSVYAYNHSDAYVKAVLYMYNAFRQKRLQQQVNENL